MRKLFEIESKQCNYSVYLNTVDKDICSTTSLADVVIADAFFEPILGESDKVIYIHADEVAKSLENLAPIFQKMRLLNIHRGSRLIAVGGGVIQDIATLVSSLYMRGIKWTYYPTTFLGMTDSCLGGKSSINVGEMKNLIGNFYPPESVIISPDFLKTLSSADIACGLVEAIKICYAKGEKAFCDVNSLTHQYFTDNSIETLTRIIELSLSSKQWFIQIDEFDIAERQLLNFGHTFGHAIESAASFGIPHGIAVGLGIQISYQLSQELHGQIDSKHATQLIELIERVIAHSKLNLHLLKQCNMQQWLSAFNGDKKQSTCHWHPIIFNAQGQLFKTSIERTPAQAQILCKSVSTTLNQIIERSSHELLT